MKSVHAGPTRPENGAAAPGGQPSGLAGDCSQHVSSVRGSGVGMC